MPKFLIPAIFLAASLTRPYTVSLMPRPPNIILILADELRHDCLGCAGNPDVRTPNIDALAKHGAHFTETIASFPRCRPSRWSLLTGQYASQHGAEDNRTPLPMDTAVFPQLLADAGYFTGCVGQMDFMPTYPDYGFSVMELAEQDSVGRTEDDYHKWLAKQNLVDQIDEWDQFDRDIAPPEYWDTFGAMTSNLPVAAYSTTWIGNQAVRFLQHAHEPFFLWTGFMKPHHPFDPPKPWDTLYNPDDLTLPPDWGLPVREEDVWKEGHFDPFVMTEPKFRKVLAHYYGTITQLDHQIGRILATLNGRGHTNNIIIFCSDHGDYMGQHGLILKSHGPPFESVLRVPLIVAGLRDQLRGLRDDNPVELLDLPGTILEAGGIRPPDTMRGRSLLPLLRGQPGPFRKAAYAEAKDGIQIVRTKDYKLVESPVESQRAFYNLRADPGEFENRYGEPALKPAQATLARELASRTRDLPEVNEA